MIDGKDPASQSRRGSLERRSGILSSPPIATQADSPSRAAGDEDDLYPATPMRPAPAIARSTLGSEQSAALFVSPARHTQQDSDEDELPANPFGGKQRLAELIAEKREERLRREVEEAEQAKSAKKSKHQRSLSATRNASSDLPDDVLDDAQGAANSDIDRIMSDASRPARKASKKALLEMERETQRLTRQQALAHQMKVRKKFTTDDLFARFNFRQQPQFESTADVAGGDTTGSSAPNSDAVDLAVGSPPKEPVSTPPSSPPTAGPTPLDKQKAIVERGALSKLMPFREDSLQSLSYPDEDENLPEIANILSSSQRLDRVVAHESLTDRLASAKQDSGNIRSGRTVTERHDNSSDDELDIIAPLPSHLKVFDSVIARPTNQGTSAGSKAIHDLRHLSHIGAYESMARKPGKPGAHRIASVNAQALEAQLRRKAKDQARQQQHDRMAELKAKGVEILTVEDREREQEVFESLLERARLEAQDLRRAEKESLKAANGEANVQPSDDEDEDEDEDEEYTDFEGDEDGNVGESDGDDSERAEDDEDGLVDDAAMESADDETGEDRAEETLDDVVESRNDTNAELGGPSEEAEKGTPLPKRRIHRRYRIVADEDEDEDEDEVSIAEPPSATRQEDPFAAFNFNAANAESALLSPTQAFKATMQTPTQETQDDSFDILRRVAPSSGFLVRPSVPPGYGESQAQTQEHDSQVNVVPAGSQSQVSESQRVNLNWETQPVPDTPVSANTDKGADAMCETPGWEPTQDAGLPSPWSRPARALQREDTADTIADDNHETQDTLRLRVSESPVQVTSTRPRRGKLVKRQAALADSSDDDDDVSATHEKRDAFREMTRRHKEALSTAERTKAAQEAKAMMDEQAEESEDEYAGLGGDDFVAPETEEDREMIDSNHVDIDERAVAAHYAERERARQEAETSKLYKDLTTGALRRKQANMFDLDEDEDEVSMKRRQMRQREEARKRKLLLQDDNIAGLAEGKQSKAKDAFLRAIADDDDGDDILSFPDDGEDASAQPTQEDSQSSQQHVQIAQPLREVSGNKRRLADGEPEPESQDRPPAKARRTQTSAFRKPASLLEVRDSVSFLLDEPDTTMVGPTALEYDSPSESDGADDDQNPQDGEDDELTAEGARQNDGGFAPNPAGFDAHAMPPPRMPASQRRTAPKPAVVNRLSLKRGSSTSESALGRTAWAAGPNTGGFKVPSLLRRATTNIASAAANDRGVTTPNFSREGSGVKMGGTKKSSLAYQARAEERRAIVDASAKRREENTARIAQMRRNSSVMGKGLTGRFE